LYKLYFKKEKVLYTNLNKCITHDHVIDGEVWILEKNLKIMKDIIDFVFEKIEAFKINLEAKQIEDNDFKYLLTKETNKIEVLNLCNYSNIQ